jgi:hypothetical protein
MAVLAVAKVLRGRLQGQGQAMGTGPIMLEQVVGHALGRPLTHARQAAQGVDEGIQPG